MTHQRLLAMADYFFRLASSMRKSISEGGFDELILWTIFSQEIPGQEMINL